MGVLEGEPRANANYMGMHNEGAARRGTSFVIRRNTALPSARGLNL
jgi:hypothetical protein